MSPSKFCLHLSPAILNRLERFAQEARAAAALRHPNIMAIFDIGDNQGSPYVVSELLEGETLRERLRTGALSIRKTIDYALQIAKGLAARRPRKTIAEDSQPSKPSLVLVDAALAMP